MHIPDGFLSLPVWAGLAGASAPIVGLLARRAQSGLEERRVPLMGMMGAFVFAAQMINIPVGAGSSGHLVGGALLAATLGPAAATVVLTAILAIQALVFQDGGLLALGANVFNMAIAGVAAGYLPYRLLCATRARRAGLFVGGFLSVFVSACLCLGELSLSGVHMPNAALGLGVLVFSVNGALEGAITVAVLAALERMNPRWLEAPAREARPALSLLGLVALILAATAFFLASSLPDGLERLSALAGLPSPEAAAEPWLRQSALAVAGLGATFAICYVLGRWITRWRRT